MSLNKQYTIDKYIDNLCNEIINNELSFTCLKEDNINNILLCSKNMFNKFKNVLINNLSIHSLELNESHFNNKRLLVIIYILKHKLKHIKININKINDDSEYNLKYELFEYINILSNINIKINMYVYYLKVLAYNINIQQFLKYNYVNIIIIIPEDLMYNSMLLINLINKNIIYSLMITDIILNDNLNNALLNAVNIYKLQFSIHRLTYYNNYCFVANNAIKKLFLNIFSTEDINLLSNYLKDNNSLITLKLSYYNANLQKFFEAILNITTIKSLSLIITRNHNLYNINNCEYICKYLKNNNTLEKLVINFECNTNYFFESIVNNNSLKTIKFISKHNGNFNLDKNIYLFLSNTITLTSLTLTIDNINNIDYLINGIKHNKSLLTLNLISNLSHHDNINILFKVLSKNISIYKLTLVLILLPNYNILTDYINNNKYLEYLILYNICFDEYNDNQFDLFADSLSQNTTIYKLKITLFNSHQIVKLFDSLKYNQYLSDLKIYIINNIYSDFNLDNDYNNIISLLHKCIKDTLNYNKTLVNILIK